MRSALRNAFLFITAIGASCATHAQQCPSPWGSAANVYGTIQVLGSGSNSNAEGWVQKIDQAISVGMVAAAPLGAQGCSWSTFEPGGSVVEDGQIEDTITSPCGGTAKGNQTEVWTAEGPGTSGSGGGFGILGTTYTFDAGGYFNGTNKISGCGDSQPPQDGPIAWGGFTLPYLTMSGSAATASGTTTVSAIPLDTSLLPADWVVTWSISPVPGDDCKPCKDHRGSELSLQSQSLGENIAIVGTPFYLHYESGRAEGHAGADAVAIEDARSLGGWTLNVHHAMEPLLLSWCAGGLCTPYAVVPKALFLGDGSTRDDSDVQVPVAHDGNLYLTSEDGSEIYEFKNYVHTRTLRPMTGAVLYSFAYDASGNLVKVTDADGNVTTIQRDANEYPTAIVSPYGQTTTLKTDSNGYLSEVADPARHAIKLTSGATGLLSSYIDANGNHYKFEYDDYGRLLNDSDTAGGSLTLARMDTNNGSIVTETTALGVKSKFQSAYSQAGVSTNQQFTNTWPNGLTAQETDVEGLLGIEDISTLPDGESETRTLAPDPRWGIQVPVTETETLKQGSLTMQIAGSRNAQVSNGNPFDLTSQTDEATINGRTYTSVFTGSDRTYVDITPAGRKVTTILDSLERIASVQVEGLLPTTFSYDARGRLSTVTQGNRTTSYSYNGDGFLASATDPLGNESKFSYDADGRPLSSTLPDGRVIGFEYDANGNLTSVTPPGKQAHTMEYTEVNLLSGYTPPALSGAGPTTYTSDADRDLTKVTRPDGRTIALGYDTAGRPSSVTTPTETIHYTYDTKTGNLDAETSTSGEEIAYSYNGPLPIASKRSGSVNGSVDVTYDDNFWVASETVDGADAIDFTYDEDGLVTRAGELAVENSAEFGLVIGATLDEAKDSYAYDSYGELSGYSAEYAGTVLYRDTYTRDADGRVSGKTETIGGKTTTYAYTYDPSGRLVSVSENGKIASTYTYDSNSNRLKAVTSSGTANGTYDDQDRLLTYGKSSFTYTPNGELATETAGTQKTSYVYDVLGNLTTVTLPDGKSITYVVDPENHRVGKEINGARSEGFLYDGDRIVAQLDGNNKIVSRFVYATGGTSPDYMISGGETYRIFSDQLGSPRVVVNASTGTIAEEITYDEFGNVLKDTMPGFQPFGFAGGLYDQDTKLVRFGARDYNPQTGRWTAKDPILFAGGDSNLYGYTQSDPINKVDPSGRSEGRDSVAGIFDAYLDSMGLLLGPTVTLPAKLAAGVGPNGGFGEALRDLAGVTDVDTGSGPYITGRLWVEVIGIIFSGGAGEAGSGSTFKAVGTLKRLDFLMKLEPCEAARWMMAMTRTAAGRAELMQIGHLAGQMVPYALNMAIANQLIQISQYAQTLGSPK